MTIAPNNTVVHLGKVPGCLVEHGPGCTPGSPRSQIAVAKGAGPSAEANPEDGDASMVVEQPSNAIDANAPMGRRDSRNPGRRRMPWQAQTQLAGAAFTKTGRTASLMKASALEENYLPPASPEPPATPLDPPAAMSASAGPVRLKLPRRSNKHLTPMVQPRGSALAAVRERMVGRLPTKLARPGESIEVLQAAEAVLTAPSALLPPGPLPQGLSRTLPLPPAGKTEVTERPKSEGDFAYNQPNVSPNSRPSDRALQLEENGTELAAVPVSNASSANDSLASAVPTRHKAAAQAPVAHVPASPVSKASISPPSIAAVLISPATAKAPLAATPTESTRALELAEMSTDFWKGISDLFR